MSFFRSVCVAPKTGEASAPPPSNGFTKGDYRNNGDLFKDLNVVVGFKLKGSTSGMGLWVLGAAAFQLVFEPAGYKDTAGASTQ